MADPFTRLFTTVRATVTSVNVYFLITRPILADNGIITTDFII